jgi:ABC-type branched-subunit amino acid transport system substrate-binding protein
MPVWRRLGQFFSVVTILLSVVAFVAAAQSPGETQPYAVMERRKAWYPGPGRGVESDLRGESIKIGLILPLEGAQAEQGNLLLQAAQIAVDEANGKTSAQTGAGLRFALAVGNEGQQWGQASNAIVQLILQEQVLAMVTSEEGKIAHQAEQIVNKLGVSVLTLSTDPTTTQINIPWIFRVGASDAEQAKAIVADLERNEAIHSVLLVAESDYDGQIGGDEFMRTVKRASMAVADEIRLDAAPFPPSDFWESINSSHAGAVVVWSNSALAKRIVELLRQHKPGPRIYLSAKAAGFMDTKVLQQCTAQVPMVVTGLANEEFARLYRAKTGVQPGMAAMQMYVAVRSVVDATLSVGANRARVRDYLATGARISVGALTFSFDPAGNITSEISLIVPDQNHSRMYPGADNSAF